MRPQVFLVLCAFAASASMLVGVASAQPEEGIHLSDYPSMPGSTPIEAERRHQSPGARFRDLISRLPRPKGIVVTNVVQGTTKSPVAVPPQSEAPFLKSLASWLSVSIPNNATPGDIEFAIRQALSESSYSGEVLSDEAFAECCAAIPTTKDTEIFKAYHAFIKKVAGKKIFVIGDQIK